LRGALFRDLNENPLFRRSSSEEKLAMFIKQFLNAQIATNVSQLGMLVTAVKRPKKYIYGKCPGE